MVTDIALAHCTANIKRHCRGNGRSVLILNNDPADLGTVAVCEDYIIAFFYDIRDVFGSLLNNFKLGFCGRRHSCFLKRIAAEGDNYLAHSLSPYEFYWQGFPAAMIYYAIEKSSCQQYSLEFCVTS